MKKKAHPKILVANRSEIACRVFQACREMGIPSVAVLAPGDGDARHVTFADEVREVPGYLDIESLIRAARESGATLVHPGYGFLSERPAFVRAVEAAGLGFIGPTAQTMEALGEKIASKELAAKSGVPTAPWARVALGADLKREAARVGYPLLLKASAGGGGKGMRRVARPEELEEAAESASAEALAAFGDGTLFLERLIEKPRHVEVQVFGDGAGGGVHLHERECSLQRRHQKVWEEAPAPLLPAKTRTGLLEASLKLARATKYRSAGTVEFLVDDGGAFYFLEMNTRLQVEHPVTEWVTGVDLVRAQIELALGGSPLEEAPAVRGHSIEVRLYAEDPYQGYIPCPGKVLRLAWPTGPGIRVDSGIEEGQAVGTGFDPMLAKLSVWAPDRAHALARLGYALDQTVIHGLGTNHGWLRALCDLPAVVEARVHTGFLDTLGPDSLKALSAEDLEIIQAAVASGAGRAASPGAGSDGRAARSPWVELGGAR